MYPDYCRERQSSTQGIVTKVATTKTITATSVLKKEYNDSNK